MIIGAATASGFYTSFPNRSYHYYEAITLFNYGLFSGGDPRSKRSTKLSSNGFSD
jgi:hypothetical protein